MSKSEKLTWCQVLLTLWGVPLFVVILVAVLPGPNASVWYGGVAWVVLPMTVAYLLILSWRAAYLAGRRR